MNSNKTKDLTTIALMAALTAIMAQIAIPMPSGVPMTLQTLAVTLAGVILGAKGGALSMLVYLLLGAVGVPVFSEFCGGLGILVGPTGGFLISFPLMAFIVGLGVPQERSSSGASTGDGKNNLHSIRFWGFLIAGTTVNYIVGTAIFCLSTGASLSAGVAACVLPFIPTTIVKALVGGILGKRIRKAIN